MTQLVKVEIRDYVAFVRLNRPEKYNALSLDMFEAIIEAGEAVKAEPSIRSVVLSGEGRGFCAGLDFESFMQMGSGEQSAVDLLRRTEDNPANFAQQTGYVWKQVPVPVIAALHGVSYGGGLQIALGADIRLASADARFSVMEIKWGLIPDMSGNANAQGPGPARCGQGADVYRPNCQSRRSFAIGPHHADLRRPLGGSGRNGKRNSRQISGCHCSREAIVGERTVL